MFKLLVLSVLLAAAVAEPDVLLSSPYAATIAAPLAPVASTYVHSGGYLPTVFSDLTYPHLIKKRSAQLLNTYVAPPAFVADPLVASAPITYASSILPAYATPAHFIKKRSAQLLNVAAPLPATYLTSDPLTSAIIPSASFYSTYPGYAGLPVIKK